MKHFWFVAQTGTIYEEEPKAPSNFYCYKLPEFCRGRVQAAVFYANEAAGGLEYGTEFLEFLEAHDEGDGK